MRRTACLLLLAWFPAVVRGAAPASAEVLTLERALELAREHNRSIRGAALEVERAEANVGVAKTRRWPSLDLQTLAGRTVQPIRLTFPAGSLGSFPSTGPIPSGDTVLEADTATSLFVNASVGQPLTQLYKINLGVKLNELTREIDKEKQRDEEASVASSVRSLYYALLQTDSALSAADQQVATYGELVRVVGEHVAHETALLADRLDAEAGLASARYQALVLRNDLATRKEQMNDLLGRELGLDFAVAPVPEGSPEETDLALAIAKAVDRRPDLAQARLRMEQAKTDLRLQKADVIPDLSLALTYFTFSNVDLLPRNVAQIGLQLKWQPFDFVRRAREVTEKRLQLEQATNAAQEAEQRVRLDVAGRHRKLGEARLELEANRLARDSAREKLRMANEKYQRDSALLREVLSAQAALGNAEARYQQSMLGLWMARADLDRAMGEEP